MKKKLAIFLLAMISCLCFAIGFSACNEATNDTPNNDDGTVNTDGNDDTDNDDGEHTHTAGEAVKENEVAATCTTSGEYDLVVYCTTCSEEISRVPTTIPATGHTEAEAVREEEIAATCTTSGSYFSVVYCSVCNKELDSEYIIVDATGHTEAEAVIENEVAATCTTIGSYDSIVYCSVCGEVVSSNKITIEATGHTKAEAVIENEVAATCTTIGSYDSVVYCSVCGEKISSETIPVPATGHSYDDGVVTTAATCTEDGVKTYTCVVCGDTKTEVLTALGHDYVEEITKEPTYTEAGLNTYTCSRCGDSYTKEIAVIGHTHEYDDGVVTTAATCTEDGVKTYTCKFCTDSYTEVIPATGHTLVQVEAQAATCTATGWDAYEYCTVCSYTTYVEIPKTEHTASEPVRENEVAATCTTIGSYDSVVYCSVCGTKLNSETVTIPATGHTYSEAWTYDETYHWHAATCEHTDEISDKSAHTYATSETGYSYCSVCGYTNANLINDSSDKIIVGYNYVVLTSSDSYISNITFTATESGTYTFTIATDCQGLIYVYGTKDELIRIGYAGYANPVYTYSFDLSQGESISISSIQAGEGYTFSEEYTFLLTVTYVYKNLLPLGTEDNPYAFTEPSLYGADTHTVTLAAGESFYFTVSSTSDTLSQIRFSSSAQTAFELYADGVKIDYGTYYFSSGSTAITFCLKNVSSEEQSNTVYCEAYSVSLATGDNTIEITSAMLDSSNSITYMVTIPSSITYAFTLGSGTDSNVAVYYGGDYGSPTSVLILGNGASEDTYKLTNSRSRDHSFYIIFTYTGSTIPDSFTVNITVAEAEAEEDSGDETAIYTAINLDEAFSMNFSSASTYYYSYTPTDSGNLTIVLTFTNTAFYNTLVSLVTVKANGTTISGSAESDGVYFVIAGGASEYKISITMSSATLTLTGTLKSGGEISTITATELVSGDNTVFNDTLYSYTASTAGTYTFTVTDGGGYTVISSGEAISSTVYFDEQESSVSYFTIELSAGEAATLYISGGNDDGFTLTIS